jgi:hypothetical protein
MKYESDLGEQAPLRLADHNAQASSFFMFMFMVVAEEENQGEAIPPSTQTACLSTYGA